MKIINNRQYVVLNDIKVGVWAIEMTDLIMHCVDFPINQKRMLRKMEELKVIFDGNQPRL